MRTHDFKYEREPTSKPAKTETRYEGIERPPAESYRQPALYRPELDPALMEKAVGQVMERYLRNDSERKEPSPQVEGHTNSETQQELDMAANALVETGPITVDAKIPDIDMSEKLVEADPLLSTEFSQKTSASMIEPAPELHESYELPVRDLELLLVELDANPFEVQPEKNIEAEPGPVQ